MKRILSPYAYFAPEQVASSYLWLHIHEALAKAGFECVIYVPIPTRGVGEEQRRNCPKHEVIFDGLLTIHRFMMYREGKKTLQRALRYMVCCMIQFCKLFFSKGDVFFLASTPPILGAVVAIIRCVRGVPFVYNLQDIFPDSLVGTSLAKRGGLLWKIGRVIENFTYRHADKIIVISEDFKKNIMAKGVPEDKIEVIYNWVDQNAVVDVPREEKI